MARNNSSVTRVKDDPEIQKQQKACDEFCAALDELRKQAIETKVKAADAAAEFDEISALLAAGDRTESDVRKVKKAAEAAARRASDVDGLVNNRSRAGEIIKERLENAKEESQNRINTQCRRDIDAGIEKAITARINFDTANQELVEAEADVLILKSRMKELNMLARQRQEAYRALKTA